MSISLAFLVKEITEKVGIIRRPDRIQKIRRQSERFSKFPAVFNDDKGFRTCAHGCGGMQVRAFSEIV